MSERRRRDNGVKDEAGNGQVLKHRVNIYLAWDPLEDGCSWAG